MQGVHLPTTFDLYRSYGAGSALTTANRCRLMEQIDEGRAALAGSMQWTHYIEIEPTVDIRDGITRATGTLTITFTEANADEVRIPNSTGTRYIVVFVVPILFGDRDGFYKKVLLFRDDPVWTGSGWSY